MIPFLKNRAIALLRWSERYTKTDMVYAVQSGWWVNLGTVTVSLFSLALYIVFARTLSPETYGVYQYLLSAGTLVGGLTLTGMNSAVIRAVARGKEGMLEKAVSVQLSWGWLPFLVALAISIYYFAHANPVLGVGFVLIGVFTPLNNALNTYSAFIAGKKDFERGFYFNFYINLLFYGTLILFAFAHPSAIALIGANFFAQAVGLWFAYRATLRAYRPSAEQDGETIGYGKHLSLMGLLGALTLQADNLLVFQMLGAAPLALYAFATAIPDRVGGLFKVFPTILLPTLSDKSEQETRRVLSPVRLAWVVAGLGVLGLLYAAAAPLLFSLLFPRYVAAVPFSQIYALSMLGVIGQIFSAALVAQKKVRSLYIFNTAVPVIQLALQFAGILLYGLWGMVGAKILSAWIPAVLSGILLFRDVSSESGPAGA